MGDILRLTLFSPQTTFPLLPKLIQPHLSLDLRFTRTQSSFFIISLLRPTTPVFRISAKLPIRKGDALFFVGGEKKGDVSLDWEWSDKEKELRIFLGAGTLAQMEGEEAIAWVFEIRYGGETAL